MSYESNLRAKLPKNEIAKILTFERLSQIEPDPLQYGGKAVGLHRLLSAGLPIPMTYCLSRENCRSLGELLTRNTVILPEPLKRALDTTGLIVRSSGVTEDGFSTSLAGQLLSVPGIFDHESFLNAIDRVLQSDPTGLGMGLVIQPHIHSTASGVAFSQNPVSGSSSVVIEAIWGDCSTLVEGVVEPDYVKLANGKLERRVGTKQFYDVSTRNGQYRLETPCDLQDRSALNDQDAHKLTELISAAETHFEHPVDVEWGLTKDTLHIFQCRPITASRKAAE